MKRFLFLIVLALATLQAFAAAPIEGPFLILSTPYHPDGSLDCETLVREARFAASWDIPGVIWPQSNDANDLLSREERFAGMAALVEEWKRNPKATVLTLGVNGDDTQEMLVYAREAERLAARSGVDLALCARPPYYGPTEQEQRAYFEALAGVARHPVIIQTYVNQLCPALSVELLVSLAEKYPRTYGWIKEESNDLEANRRQQEEVASPAIKTVFSAWGGWQWLYQHRHTGTRGLITERVAYSPIVSCVWQAMTRPEKADRLTEAYALYRLLIDQRFLKADNLRGYALHYFVRLGIFSNTLSRVHAAAPDGPRKTYSREKKGEWKLKDIDFTPAQLAERDACYDAMMDFVKRFRSPRP